MSPRVNLLPGEVEARNRASRQRVGLGIGAVLLIAVLVVAYLFQAGRVNDVEEQLAAEQQELAALEADLATLREFDELERRTTEAQSLLTAALGLEASLAGVLQDLAAVMPTDADLLTLTLSVAAPGEVPPLGADRVGYGTLAASGRTTRGHAPGLERLLLDLEKPAAFGDVYFGSSVLDEEQGFATFTVEVALGREILTGRYATGLPEELR
jgi:Tfp pilus assembly protein PilN